MTQFGRYENLQEIGRGGFAVVYKAHDPKLNRTIALKVLHAGYSSDPNFVDRFHQEAQTVASFNHPNIVTIYDYGEEDRQLYIAMEFLAGGDLQAWLNRKEGPLPIEEALPFLKAIASALDYAHHQGVVHRDIKPSNMILQQTGDILRIMLTDFGLVKAMEGSMALTMTNQMLGSPEYMAPEQADITRIDEIGPATDLYAFGIVAYQMLAGRVPFPGHSLSVLNAHVSIPAPSPRELNENLSPEVAVILLKMLSKAPADRYPTAVSFVEALQTAVQTAVQTRHQEAQVAPLYDKLLTAKAESNWLEMITLAAQIEVLLPNYKDVTILRAQAQQMLRSDPATTKAPESADKNRSDIQTKPNLQPIPLPLREEQKRSVSSRRISEEQDQKTQTPTTKSPQTMPTWLTWGGLVAALLLLCIGSYYVFLNLSNNNSPEEPTAKEEAVEAVEEESSLPDLGGREVTIAVENAYLPFNYIDPDTGEPSGWDYDVWNEICSLINCTPVYVEVGWESMIQAVADGQYDAAADGITITEDRAEIVDFSNGYINTDQRLLVRLDEDRIESIDDIVADEELLLGTQIGTTNYETALQYLDADRIQAFEQFPVAVQALIAGDIDAFIIDEVAEQGNLVDTNELKLVGPSISSDQLGFIYPKGSELVEPVNAALAELAQNGFLEEVNAKYFGPEFTITYDDLFPPEESEEEAMEIPIEEEPRGEMAEVDFAIMPGGYLARAVAGEFSGSTVIVDGSFDDDRVGLLMESMKSFEEATGITVNYIGDDEFEQRIIESVSAGNAPDIADFPQPGLLRNFVSQGYIVDPTNWMSEEFLANQYNQSWLDMATMEGQFAGIWHRYNIKSLVWYPKAQFDAAGYEVPESWNDLLALTQMIADDGDAPWCIGLESGFATGWVATDWTEDLMLRTTSLENYDAWIAGDLPFSSNEVKNAIEIWSEIWFNDDYVLSGTNSIVTTSFVDSPAPMFEDDPRCWLHRQGSFITVIFPEGTQLGIDYDFFYLPTVDKAHGKPILMAGDIMALFNDTPEAKALMEYFATPQSVSSWLEKGGALAAHQTATPDMYGTDMGRELAELANQATSLRFDASDMMPGEVGTGTFWTGMTNYVSGAADLDTVLDEIDASWP